MMSYKDSMTPYKDSMTPLKIAVIFSEALCAAISDSAGMLTLLVA